MQITRSLLLIVIVQACLAQNLVFLSPSAFVETFRDNKIKVISSPIGFKPQSGSLHGKIVLANPLNACIDVQQVQDIQGDQDVFMMADDLGCLQSVKAHNLAASGAYIGLIKRNINNTLNDRQVDIVHIPILQLQPDDYNRIYDYISKNKNQQIQAIADFNPEVERKKINIELWLSPLQEQAYQYILSLQKFITKQPNLIQFSPRFVLQSQMNRKQYIGCLSSGRFCPPELQYEGRPEGAKIVGEVLRQIIISSRDVSQWFKYANYYYQNCLRKAGQNLWQQQNSELCSQSAMMSSGITSTVIMTEYKTSFRGSRPEVDSNIYLEQQRQLYIEEQITKYPVLIINGKQYFIEQSPSQLQLRICNMIHPNVKEQPKECQSITNPPLFSPGEIFVIVGVSIGLLVTIMIVCKKVIYVRMKREMKGEVQKTLSQYYRYMDTFEEPDPSAIGRVPLVEPKVETNQIGSVELSEIKNNS